MRRLRGKGPGCVAVGGVVFQAGRQEHVKEPQGAWKQVLKGADGRRRGQRSGLLKRTRERRMGVGLVDHC